MTRRRVNRHDDFDLEIDYGTGHVKDIAGLTERICFFTLRASGLCSHYFIVLPLEADKLAGKELRGYVLEHLNHAQHTRTCEKVR